MGLNGQRVVLIGGTTGIGFATAQAAAAEGAEVVVASRSKEKIDQALEQLPATAVGRQVDMADEDGVREFFEETGRFDHLVYTAGDHIFFKSLEDVTTQEARDCFGTRYWGAFLAAKHGVDRIRAGGSIILTAGIVSVRPNPLVVAPASVTGAIEAMVRALAVELAPIRVNAVRLGPVPSQDSTADIPNREELYRSISAKLLTRRMGVPAEAAESYLYLMKGSFTTGVILTTDGGYVLV